MSITRPTRGLTFIYRFREHIEGAKLLPSALWVANDEVVGDATGGIVQMTFAPPTAVGSAKNIWSVEEVNLTKAAAAAGASNVNINTQETIPTGDNNLQHVVSHEWVAGATESGVVYAARADRIGTLGRPFRPRVGVTWSVVMEMANSNGTAFTANAWGYTWDQARVLQGFIPTRPS